jgi:hypothetical protein
VKDAAMDESGRQALREIAAAAAHTAHQSTHQPHYIPSRFPRTYAYDFIRANLTILPNDVLAEVENTFLSRGDAARAVKRWAQAINVAPEAIMVILADAQLAIEGIPLSAADAERVPLAEFTLASTPPPPATLAMKWCPECGKDDRDGPVILGPHHFAPDAPLYCEENGGKKPNHCPGKPITLTYDLRVPVRIAGAAPHGGTDGTHT